ncbi:hypothetical protein SLEP1_g30411 [Rubroshorea leprosula]|uniref:Integrase catalytic domain-containing protein n=1 Tax=Rubroshorea leprosula TaxID=152421 RepID=A0AAV5K8E1_9ROSI|nr:hypothetical protein SLEP1_g30411 [Rubroshorea leprosula]
MVKTRSVRGGNSSQPLGRGQVPSNFPPHPPPPIPNTLPHVDHVEGGDENQPHNSAHNSASTANQDVVATQLAAMQQQFGVFQLVLAQLLAWNNPGDPLINLLNPAPQPPAPQQNPEPVQHAPAISESQGHSHIAPVQLPLPDDVTRRLDNLEKLVVEQKGAPPPRHAADSIPHPLNTNITLEPYPAGFRIPQLETYDGTKDPDDHLHAFYSCMQAQNASDALMCKIFPSTLRGNARTWYYSLPPRSISSYTEMASAFAIKFSSRRLIRKTTSELMRVRQRDGESLKNFMSIFNDAVLEVNSFDQAVGITAVISGLSHERFRDSLLKHPATTFSENQHPDWRDENPNRKRMKTTQNQGLQPQGVRNPPNRQGVGYQQTPPPLPPPTRVIHMITGGLEAGGLSSKQRKLYVREVKHQNRAQKRKFDDAEWKNQPITFTSVDLDTVVTPHNDPLVTSITINNCEEQRVLIDTRSVPDIMYFHCFESLGLDPALLQRYDGPIYGFNNQPVLVEGVLTMNVAFGGGRSYVIPSVRFLVVKMASSFNVVIGRPTLIEIRAVVSQSHLCMKFPTPMGIATLRDETRAAPVEDVEEVHIDDRDPSRKMQIGTKLNPEERAELIAFLWANKDVFAWTSANMPGIPTSVSQHKLSTNPLKKPVAQKRRLFGGERLQVIKEEVEKLLRAGFVRRVDYCEWVANPVLVKKANELKVEAIQIYSDSQLVVNQVNLVCEVVDPVMMKYATLVAELKSKFQKFHLSKIPRVENEQADSLSKFASDGNQSSRSVFVEILDEPSFLKPRMMVVSTDPSSSSWTDPIISFLRDGTVPADKQEEMRLRKKASWYTLGNDVLYKRSFSLPLLRCLTPYEAEYALREVHEGVCESYVGARTLAHKVLRQGPFMKGVGGVTHLIVGVDYFTKWVEARALSSLTSKKVEDFVFSSIISRYGIPSQIVANNGTQFNCSSFRDFCSSYGIKLQFTSVYHPESNGMVDSVNKCILKGIKPRLEQHKANWADELNNVLWAYRTMSRTATGETPYHLAFGTEAVILIEIGVPSFRVTHFDEGRNGQLLRENLDLLDEVREEAQLRTLVYKQKVANFYNKRVRPRTFKVGDLILRKAGLTGFETRFGKLAPNWEGPYTIVEVPYLGAYILRDIEGKRVPRVWNVNNLKKFYP